MYNAQRHRTAQQFNLAFQMIQLCEFQIQVLKQSYYNKDSKKIKYSEQQNNSQRSCKDLKEKISLNSQITGSKARIHTHL